MGLVNAVPSPHQKKIPRSSQESRPIFGNKWTFSFLPSLFPVRSLLLLSNGRKKPCTKYEYAEENCAWCVPKAEIKARQMIPAPILDPLPRKRPISKKEKSSRRKEMETKPPAKQTGTGPIHYASPYTPTLGTSS